MFLANGGTVTLLITPGIPCMHLSIRVVETSQLHQAKIISGSRVLLSDHLSDPLTRLTMRRGVWSEKNSSHLKTMGLKKCQPVKVNPLTVRGSQKNPSTLTNFLPEYKFIQTRDISQEIGNGHSPLWSFLLIILVQEFIHSGKHGKLSQNMQVSQVQPVHGPFQFLGETIGINIAIIRG